MSGTIDKSRAPAAAVLFGVGLCLALAAPAGAWSVERAAVETADDGVLLRLQSAGLDGAAVPHDLFVLEDPWRVVVDLFGAEAPAAVDGAPAMASADPPARLRWSLWRNDPAGNVVRYVVEMDQEVRPVVEDAGGELCVLIRPAGPDPDPAGQAASVPLSVSAPPAESAEFAEFSDASDAADAADAADASPAAGGSQVADAATFADDGAVPDGGLLPPPPAVRNVPAAETPVPVAVAAIPREPFVASLEQDEAPPLGDVDAAAAPAPSPGVAAADTRPMNLDVQGADIRTVLRSIADYGRANIVADRNVEGPVTVRLQQVPWRQALDIVCHSAGLIAVDGDQVIRVAAAKTWQEEGIEREANARKKEDFQPLLTRTFNIRYANAKELSAAIAFALSKRGSANVDERTNTIMVSDIEPRLAEVERLIGSLDTETLQVEIEARLVDVDKTASRQLGISWNLENLHSDSERLSGDLSVSEPLVSASGQMRLGMVRPWGNLDATIEALERHNHATLISNPKITTVNNRQANILVGKEIPLIVLDEAGNATIELKKVGIQLQVTPYINSENMITMDLHPEVSDLSQQATVQGGVVFNTTLADTRVMVRDGETAVIGGLVRSSEVDFGQGIPILRSIPLLGALFRSTDRREESRELLIFVTPRVVNKMAMGEEALPR